MIRSWIAGLALATACSCTAVSPPEVPPAVPEPTPEQLAAAIRTHEQFGQPAYLEIWANAPSPTAQLMVGQGYLERGPADSRLHLTPRGRDLGTIERAFQSDVPVYSFPIARRELIATEPPRPVGSSLRHVEFTYRRIPTPLGAELAAAGSRAVLFDEDAVLRGSALVSLQENASWTVSSLRFSTSR